MHDNTLFSMLTKNVLHYYASIARIYNLNESLTITRSFFHNYNINNIVVFSQPKKQLFFVIFKKKPIFVFTGGLMRKVMNEKRKSSKKAYKVATSLIKLSTILLSRRNFLNNCYLKLNRLGSIRTKILSAFAKYKLGQKVHYIMIYFPRYMNAQKFSTRRAIKKYVKKRFKI